MTSELLFSKLQVDCPIGISSVGNSGCFPRPGKASCDRVALSNLRCTLGVSVFRNPPNSDMDYGIFNVRTEAYGHRMRVCTESWLWEKKKNFPHRGIEPASAACRSDVLPTELHPCLYSVIVSVTFPLKMTSNYSQQRVSTGRTILRSISDWSLENRGQRFSTCANK